MGDDPATGVLTGGRGGTWAQRGRGDEPRTTSAQNGDRGVLFTAQGTPQIAANTGSLERQEGSFPTALEGSATLPHADVQLGLRTVGMYLPW